MKKNNVFFCVFQFILLSDVKLSSSLSYIACIF